jgi:molecular chaperone HtpG
MSTGKINVSVENIFPLIKKFLYNDHEIFLRELVSNATDATLKLKHLTSIGEAKVEYGNPIIEVKIDKEGKKLHIIDQGLGMTADEVEKYINQVAFSGAEEFLEKYKDSAKDAGIIGHFGLGFYSAFMVAEKVEIITKSYKDEPAAHWTCDGSPEFTLEAADKTTRGSEIILHIAEDSLEFLEEFKIRELLTKYNKFMPVPIKFGTKKETLPKPEDAPEDFKPETIEVDNIINNPNPAWTKLPTDLNDEDYKQFYHELYPMQFEEPLFNIHLNVDYPFNLTGILYFPKMSSDLQLQKDKIQLYQNQVYVTDNVEGIVPEFLGMLKGVIDSPDIPLNVSRSYLQSDGNVKKISAHITKKVADKLAEMYKNDRKDFEEKWDDLQIFVQYGSLSDEKFADKAKTFTLLKDTKGGFYTVEEFKEKVAPLQTNKDGKVVFLYTNNPEEQYSFIKKANDRGYEVLHIDGPLAPHWISLMEQSFENCSFARVDADTLDKLIQKTDEIPSKLSKEDEEKLQPVFEKVLSKDKFKVQFESMSADDAPIIITQPEFIRRMMEQQKIGGAGFMGAFPEMYTVAVNGNHAKIGSLLQKEEAAQVEFVKQLTDLALLSQGMLKGAALNEFIERTTALVE